MRNQIVSPFRPAHRIAFRSRAAASGRALTIILLLVLVNQTEAIDWYRWRGPDLNGISKEAGWSSSWSKEGPEQLWKANVGAGFSSITVSHGRVFTLGNDGKQDTVFCFAADRGTPIWKYSYAAPLDPKWYEGGPSSTPTVDAERVYTLSKNGILHCLSATDGKSIWAKDLPAELGMKIPTWGFAGSPLIAGDLLVLNVGSAGTAIDPSNGKVVWTSGKGESGYSTPVFFDAGSRQHVVLFLADSVAALEVKDGKEVWRQNWQTKYDVNAADPIIAGDRVFISSGYDRGCALLKIVNNKASLEWESKNMRNHFNTCVLINGHLYGFDESEFKCIDSDTGDVRWSEGGLGKGSLMAADGKLIVLSEKGELVVADATPARFKPLARAQVLGGKCWTTPVLSNGRIYCRNARGDLVCLNVAGK